MPSKTFQHLSPFISILPERIRLKILYFYKHGKILDLDNPKSFNEKIQWAKIYSRYTNFTKITGKIQAKEFINPLNIEDLYVAKTLWSNKNFDDLIPENLPLNFVLKSNHASGTVLFIKRKSASSLYFKELKKVTKNWFKIRLDKTFVEYGYSQIEPCFYAEEFLSINNNIPMDYKFWVFHGKVELIQLDINRFSNHIRCFFDKQWKNLDIKLTYPKPEILPHPPKNIERMIQIAETIANTQNLDFIRIDLYSDNQKVYFGECTLYPGSGFERLQPPLWDQRLGDL